MDHFRLPLAVALVIAVPLALVQAQTADDRGPYARFGHSAAGLDNPVPPAEDERDNVANVAPHAEFTGNALYEFLPSAAAN
jgi:hypothetical protein